MKSNRNKTDRLRQVWAKTKGVCAHCGNPSSGKDRTVDHYVPKSYDGGNDLRNLLPLCKKCNLARGNKPIDPFEFINSHLKNAFFNALLIKMNMKISAET